MSRLVWSRMTLWFLVAAAAAMLALSALGLWQVQRMAVANDWVQHTREVLAQADQVRQLLLDAEAAARGYAIADRAEFAGRYRAAASELPLATQRLAALVQDNDAQARGVTSLGALVTLRIEQLNEVIELRDRRGVGASQQVVASGVGEAVTAQIRQALTGIRADEHALLKTRLHRAAAQRSYVQAALLLLGATGAAFLLMAWRSSHRALREREAAERLARIGEARLFSTLQSCGDGLIVTDEGGRVTMINPVAEALTGWRADQARGAPLDEVFRIVNEFTREAVESPVGRVLREGKVVGLANHTVLLTRDGTERPIDDSGAPIRTAGGELIGVVLVFRDVTARKLSEQARERLLLAEAAREAAVKASEAKDQFLGLVSHELRSPLAAMHGLVTLLQRGSLPPAEIPAALQRIARNVRQQQRVVSDLLDVSRIVAGKLEIVRTPLDLATIVHATLDECGHYAQDKGITLTHRLDGPLFVLADEQRLVQIVSNLLGNAIKFTEPGGKVSVQVTQDSGWAMVRVSDTGVGLSAEALEHVFERFWQAEGGPTRKQGGLGLGLALTRHIVEQHGGDVQASSPGPGRGATFTVRLPLAAQEAGFNGPEPSSAGVPAGALTGVRVMVVEDDTDSRDAIALMLQLAGASVLSAASVREALEGYDRGSLHVVVSDLGMPGEDGYALAQEIRRRDVERARQTALIALTGFVGASDRGAVREAGFSAHLEKPVDFDALIAAISALAQGARR